MTAETSFRNARIVLADEIVEGSLLVRNGRIAAVDSGPSALGEDLEGDLLIPGLVELHTDHLEAHYMPRAGVRWPALAAVQAHDAQIAASAITTVFDCLRVGSDQDDPLKAEDMRVMAQALAEAEREDRLRAEHLIHLRCEVSAPDMGPAFEGLKDDPRVRIVSVMDHAPGQRQFRTMEQYTLYYKSKRGLSDAEFARFVESRQAQSARWSAPHRRLAAEHCRAAGVTLASHDDATLEHVEEAIRDGVRLAEFPTSIEAAQASHAAGLSVLMGAPNLVRGGSHSGNVAALDLARLGILDVLSSDYVPSSLLYGVFRLVEEQGEAQGVSLPQALAAASLRPARTAGLEDRGEIAPGKRADLARLRWRGGTPQVRGVWRAGRRTA